MDTSSGSSAPAGPQRGSAEILRRLIEALRSERGVHIESLLCLLGALGGFACRVSANGKKLVRVDGLDGRSYFFGDAINRPLAEGPLSIWSIAAATAQGLGAERLPNLDELFEFVAETAGTEDFGLPRIPADHRPTHLPIDYVKDLWPFIHPIAARFCSTPDDLPVLFALAIQRAMTGGADVLDPRLALAIVMESAVPMSKIDVSLIPGSEPPQRKYQPARRPGWKVRVARQLDRMLRRLRAWVD